MLDSPWWSLGVSETRDRVARCDSAPTPLSREFVYDFWREMTTLRRKYRLDSNEILEALIDDDDSDLYATFLVSKYFIHARITQNKHQFHARKNVFDFSFFFHLSTFLKFILK